jgi:hypothetical protein
MVQLGGQDWWGKRMGLFARRWRGIYRARGSRATIPKPAPDPKGGYVERLAAGVKGSAPSRVPPASISGDFQMRVDAQVAQIKASNLLGRSDPLIRLLDYFASHAASGGVPKEFEIAHEVFAKDSDFDVAQDATIRVYVHRLRKKLEEYYALNTQSADRLTIPRGTYRLMLVERDQPLGPGAEAGPEAAATVPPEPAGPPRRQGRGRRFLAAVAAASLCGAAGVAAGMWLTAHNGYSRPLAESGVWRPLTRSDLRTFFVVGDQQLAEEDGRFVSAGSLKAVGTMSPAINSIVPSKSGAPPITTMSRMSPYMLAENNLIYIGTVRQLGLLNEVLAPISNYEFDQQAQKIIDRQSGRQFVLVTDEKQRRDFAYIACFDRPSGNRIIVIAGLNDGALTQMASLALDPAQLARLTAQAGDNFEAIFSVSVIKGVNVGYHLEAARALTARR